MNSFYKIMLILLSISVFTFGQTNLIQNGDFENWSTGMPVNWEFRTPGPHVTATKDSNTVHNGSYSCNILFTTQTQAETDFTNATSSVAEGIEYTYNVWVYDNDPAGRVRIVFVWFDAGMNFISTDYDGDYSSDDPNWQQLSHVATAPTGAAFGGARFRFYDVSSGWDGDCEIIVDEVEFIGPGSNSPIITNLTTGHFDAGVAIDIEADITDDQGINQAWLHYRQNLVGIEDSVQMSLATGDTYQGTIPAQTNNTGLEYWVSATDIDATTNYSVSNVVGTIVGIADISRAHEIDANGEMLYDNFLAKIRGVVTVATGTFSSTAQDDYMQDNTGGINIFDFAVVQSLALGDSIEVSGRFSNYNAKSEIVDFSINVLSTGNPVPAPVVIATTDMSEQYEGMLIRINQGAVSNWVAQPPDTNFNATLTTADGDLTIRVDKDTDIGGNPAPAGLIDLIGIGAQNDFTSPFTEGYQILPRSWADFILTSGVGDQDNNPVQFSLKQNYPNPFNPKTKIEFSIADVSNVQLVVYNLLGQEIRSFSEQNLAKGVHHFNWNGKDNNGLDVASGIYIYRLKAGEFISTKKMALLR